MIKVKLLKDIPGYGKGFIFESNVIHVPVHGDGKYSLIELVQEGWAEEIKDDIDIEEIRKDFTPYIFGRTDSGKYGTFSGEELAWFNSYRMVKAVIEKLNTIDVEKPIPKDAVYNDDMWTIRCDRYRETCTFRVSNLPWREGSILPRIRNVGDAKELIALVPEELKVLFGVK